MKVIAMSASVNVLMLVLSALSFSASATESDNVFKDPLDTPAKKMSGSLALSEQPIVATEIIGKRTISVGQRGLIIFSDDQGTTWEQAEVPVQSDLTAIDFPTEDVGFVVGHDGVILASEDAGKTWRKKLDGNVSGPLFIKHYEDRIASGEHSLEGHLDQVKLNSEGGATLPYLSVYFESPESGYAVGAFGSIIKTEDGGSKWFPAFEEIENPGFLHLNEIKKVGSDLYIVGEQSTIWKRSSQDDLFRKYTAGQGESLFGMTGNSDCQLVFGIMGAALRSVDSGETWVTVEVGTESALVAGDTSPQGQQVVVSENGEVFRLNRSCTSLEPITTASNGLSSSVKFMKEDSNAVIVTGYIGLEILDIE